MRAIPTDCPPSYPYSEEHAFSEKKEAAFAQESIYDNEVHEWCRTNGGRNRRPLFNSYHAFDA
jgi:hypothetical protein